MIIVCLITHVSDGLMNVNCLSQEACLHDFALNTVGEASHQLTSRDKVLKRTGAPRLSLGLAPDSLLYRHDCEIFSRKY